MPTTKTAQDILSDLFNTQVIVSTDFITVRSNTGNDREIRLTEPTSIRDIFPDIKPNVQILIDGVEVNKDHIVSPGTEMYFHTVVAGA